MHASSILRSLHENFPHVKIFLLADNLHRLLSVLCFFPGFCLTLSDILPSDTRRQSTQQVTSSSRNGKVLPSSQLSQGGPSKLVGDERRPTSRTIQSPPRQVRQISALLANVVSTHR